MAFGAALLSALAGAPEAYQQTRGRQLALNEKESDQFANAALANAAQIWSQSPAGGMQGGSTGSTGRPNYAAMGGVGGGPGAGGPQPTPPGQASQPMQGAPGPSPFGPPPGMGQMPGGMPPPPSSGPGPMPPGAPNWAQAGLPGMAGVPPMSQQPGMAPMQAMAPRPMPQMAPGGGPPSPAARPPAAPPGMSPPPAGGKLQDRMPMGGSQQPGMQQGQMDWRQMLQAIFKANPGISPQVAGMAVTKALPLMNMASKQEWLMAHNQFLQQQLEARERMFNARSDQASDLQQDRQVFQKEQADAKKEAADAKTKAGEEDVANIVEGIKSGQQPPTVTGLYGKGPAVRAGLAKAGFDLSKAQLEWQGAQRQTASLNGPQVTRFTTLASTVDSTIDRVKELAEQMKLKNIPLVNQLELQAYIKAQGDTPNSELATRYMTAVNGLKEEFANLANGGYAPTEPAWKLANEQINGNYSVGKLSASLDEVQRLVRYRLNAIQSRAGTGNRYEPQQGASPGGGGAGKDGERKQFDDGKGGTVWGVYRNGKWGPE